MAQESNSGVMDKVRERASAGLTNQKERATDGLGSIAGAARQTTRQLREQQHDTAARYVEQAAEQLERFADHVRQKDVGEIVNDAQRLARRQPALFVGSAFAIGLVSARFLKSSRSGNETSASRRTRDSGGITSSDITGGTRGAAAAGEPTTTGTSSGARRGSSSRVSREATGQRDRERSNG